MTTSRTTNRFVALISVAALLTMGGCPGGVQKVAKYVKDEKSAVNSPAAEGAKDVAKNAAKEALGPAGTVVDVGEAALGAVNAGAQLAIQKAADEAMADAMLNPGDPALEKRAIYLEAKADCFLRKDCKKWYELNPKPDQKEGSGGGSH